MPAIPARDLRIDDRSHRSRAWRAPTGGIGDVFLKSLQAPSAGAAGNKAPGDPFAVLIGAALLSRSVLPNERKPPTLLKWTH